MTFKNCETVMRRSTRMTLIVAALSALWMSRSSSSGEVTAAPAMEQTQITQYSAKPTKTESRCNAEDFVAPMKSKSDFFGYEADYWWQSWIPILSSPTRMRTVWMDAVVVSEDLDEFVVVSENQMTEMQYQETLDAWHCGRHRDDFRYVQIRSPGRKSNENNGPRRCVCASFFPANDAV